MSQVKRKKTQMFESTVMGDILIPERDVFDESSLSEEAFYLDLGSNLQLATESAR